MIQERRVQSRTQAEIIQDARTNYEHLTAVLASEDLTDKQRALYEETRTKLAAILEQVTPHAPPVIPQEPLPPLSLQQVTQSGERTNGQASPIYDPFVSKFEGRYRQILEMVETGTLNHESVPLLEIAKTTHERELSLRSSSLFKACNSVGASILIINHQLAEGGADFHIGFAKQEVIGTKYKLVVCRFEKGARALRERTATKPLFR